MPVLRTRTASLSAKVQASCDNKLAKCKFRGLPLVSILRTYVCTVNMKIDIQKSEKKPYSGLKLMST